MRIHGHGPQGVPAVESKKPEAIGPAPRAERNEPVKVATGAQRIVAAVTRDEAAAAERVAAVRAAIENGTYRIDLDKLADRIAEEELARLGR